MRLRFTPPVVILFVMAIYACQCAYYYPHLPDPLATHFGPDGRPNGWMPKAAFVTSFGLFLLIFMTFLSGTATLFRIVPTEMINLPNKDYWLAPERKPTTIATLSSYMLSMAAATGALMLCVAQYTFKANLMPEPNLGAAPWVLLGIFFVYTLAWTVSLLRRFQMSRG